MSCVVALGTTTMTLSISMDLPRSHDLRCFLNLCSVEDYSSFSLVIFQTICPSAAG